MRHVSHTARHGFPGLTYTQCETVEDLLPFMSEQGFVFPVCSFCTRMLLDAKWRQACSFFGVLHRRTQARDLNQARDPDASSHIGLASIAKTRSKWYRYLSHMSVGAYLHRQIRLREAKPHKKGGGGKSQEPTIIAVNKINKIKHNIERSTLLCAQYTAPYG